MGTAGLALTTGHGLCLALECTAEQVGLPATPSLSRSIRKLAEQRDEQAPTRANQLAMPRADVERIQATLTRLWPVDRPLLDGLNRVARQLGHRRDTEPPSAVLADLGGYLDILIELLSRSQSSDHARDLRQIAAFVAQPGATEVRQLDELLGYQRRG